MTLSRGQARRMSTTTYRHAMKSRLTTSQTASQSDTESAALVIDTDWRHAPPEGSSQLDEFHGPPSSNGTNPLSSDRIREDRVLFAR